MNTETLETSLATIDPEVPREAVLQAVDFVARLGEIYRQLKAQLDARMVEWIDANGELVNGEVRYYVGNDKDTKCVDLKETLNACYAAAGGDEDALITVLSTNAFKPGACRKLLPADTYAKCFVTTERVKVLEGKPVKQLQKFDGRFVR